MKIKTGEYFVGYAPQWTKAWLIYQKCHLLSNRLVVFGFGFFFGSCSLLSPSDLGIMLQSFPFIINGIF